MGFAIHIILCFLLGFYSNDIAKAAGVEDWGLAIALIGATCLYFINKAIGLI